MALASDRVIKTHCLQAKEQMTPKLRLWRCRVIRAAKKRLVRLFLMSFSPAMNAWDNMVFQTDLAQAGEGDAEQREEDQDCGEHDASCPSVWPCPDPSQQKNRSLL